MGIVVNLEFILSEKKIKSKELAEIIGITEANLSILKSGKAKAIRFSTLEAICVALNCQPADILEYKEDPL
ncbi:helix-turn-helix transcriptional regulator [Arenibacter sp. GZD96]|uniref:helix-turn-helix domain-containing protein n=1 Tax=Aurantibrevibacter litoralis TaxID=3106030 RepID=UPI002AFF0943|nr:helix-turn-helix transcriptional regulator [Arenibacter sp. GZD-96]MEA1787238.1 helix-turn-helix transcriptional regulator [Arenibacter sp. GZD-96]